MRILLVASLVAALALTACVPNEGPTNKEVQAAKAEAAAQTVQFSENAEIDNIKARLQLTADPGLVGFVVLLNEMGQPVMYTGVKGKITSGSKRLTRTDEYSCETARGGGYTCDFRPSASDEGTYGSSNPYIFFWTPEGQYVQWSGEYLYSDKPIRLSSDPLIVTQVQSEPAK
jgi:hypothetical protein